MKRFATLIAIAIFTVAIAAPALADTNDTTFSPARIQLTVHQERALMQAVERGTDRFVLPLTHDQQAQLESQWPGWSASVLTIFAADMLDHDGSIWTMPR